MAVNNNNTSTTPSTNQPQPAPAPAGMGGEQFFNLLGSKLLEQGGIISSTASNLENKISGAISGIRESANLSNRRIESVFGREIENTLEGANETMVSGRAAGSGGLMNMAALRELTSTTDKQLNDLKQRKEELILQNNADAASKIAELEVKTLEFRMNAQQKVFENLLGMGNFGLSVAQERRLGAAQTFEEKRAISNIALEFGLEVGPNDTIETITAKAAPFADEKRRAELARTLAETNRIYADTRRIQAEGAEEVDDLDTIANAYFSLEMQGKDPTMVLTNLSDTKAAQVLLAADKLKIEDYKGNILSQIESGKSKNLLSTQIKSDQSLTSSQKADALKYLNDNWKEPEKRVKNANTRRTYTNTTVNRATGVGIGNELYADIARRLGF